MPRAKSVPRFVAAEFCQRGIVERRTPQAPVVEEKSARLDDVDGDGKACREAQQRAGVLRDIRLVEGKAQEGWSRRGGAAL